MKDEDDFTRLRVKAHPHPQLLPQRSRRRRHGRGEAACINLYFHNDYWRGGDKDDNEREPKVNANNGSSRYVAVQDP